MSDSRANDIERGRAELIAKLSAIEVPSLSRSATPGEIRGVKEHLESVCRAFDSYIEQIGQEVRGSISEHLDESQFREATINALDGYALYELECAAEHVQISMREPS